MEEKAHKRLEAWRKALDLVVSVYDVTASFPPEERFGIISQMRRAAISIPSNIAEGAARGSNKFFTNALHIARGSLSELDTQIEVARRLGYLDQVTWNQLNEAVEEVDRILNGLIRAVRRKVMAGVLGVIALFAFLAV